MSRQNIVQPVAYGRNVTLILCSLRPGADGRQGALHLYFNIAGNQSLYSGPAASNVNRLHPQAVFFKRSRALGDPEKAGRTAERIRDLDLPQLFSLRKKKIGTEKPEKKNRTKKFPF